MGHHPSDEQFRSIYRYLHVVSAMCVVFGLYIAADAAFTGQVIPAVGGFLIVVLAVTGTWLCGLLMRIALTQSAVLSEVTRLHEKLSQSAAHIESSTWSVEMEAPDSPVCSSASESMQAAPLSAAAAKIAVANQQAVAEAGETLDALERAETPIEETVRLFPRLVYGEPDKVPDQLIRKAPVISPRGQGGQTSETGGLRERRDRASAGALRSEGICDHPHALIRDECQDEELLGRWRAASEVADVEACRELLELLRRTLGEEQLCAVEAEWSELVHDLEQALRAEFRACVGAQDLEGMARAGEQILELIPDCPTAEEIRLILPRIEQALRIRDQIEIPSSGQVVSDHVG